MRRRFGLVRGQASLDGANRGWDAAVARDEDVGGAIAIGDLPLEIQAVDVGQLHIEGEAAR